MEDKDPRKMKGFEKFFQKKKAIAGIVLLLAATFGVLISITEIPTDATGYFLAEETTEEALLEDLEMTLTEYEEIYEEDEALERAVEDWAERKTEEGYTEEELKTVLVSLEEDPDLLDSVSEQSCCS